MSTTTKTTDEAIRREVLDQLLDQEPGAELRDGIERLRRFFGPAWFIIHEIYLDADADPSKLKRWREAPAGSREAWKASEHDRALSFLSMWAVLRRDS